MYVYMYVHMRAYMCVAVYARMHICNYACKSYMYYVCIRKKRMID